MNKELKNLYTKPIKLYNNNDINNWCNLDFNKQNLYIFAKYNIIFIIDYLEFSRKKIHEDRRKILIKIHNNIKNDLIFLNTFNNKDTISFILNYLIIFGDDTTAANAAAMISFFDYNKYNEKLLSFKNNYIKNKIDIIDPIILNKLYSTFPDIDITFANDLLIRFVSNEQLFINFQI